MASVALNHDISDEKDNGKTNEPAAKSVAVTLMRRNIYLNFPSDYLN